MDHPDSHTADALVLTCMDFRLHSHQQLAEFLKKQGIHTWDLRTQQGVAKDLTHATTGGHKESLLEAIRIATELHGVRQVLIMNHRDCGAYGGAKAFSSAEEEHDRHVRDLREAQTEVHTVFPQLTVRLFLIGIKKQGGASSLTFQEVV